MKKTTRPYTKKRRAEQQAETRLRIVDAAVDLHGSVGPAATTVKMIAEHAGVQRHTYYAHFPEDRDLYLACSGRALERDPMPDPASWRDIAGPRERLTTGLAEIYGWYERNAGLAGCVLRDAEHHPLTREMIELRMAPVMAMCRSVLATGLEEGRLPLLDLALGFYCWRSLVRDSGLATQGAVALMVGAVLGSDDERQARKRKPVRGR